MENQSTINYSIETLPDIFAAHARIANNMNEGQLNSFIEKNPGEPVPDYLQNPFNIALALSIICQAIKDLQEKP